MNLNTVPKMGPPGGPIWDRMRSLVKEQKKSTFTVPFWDRLAVPKMRPQNRKIHSKGRPLQQTKTLQLGLLKQSAYRFGTEEARMRSLISIDFPAPEMEPESAHVVSAVSVP